MRASIATLALLAVAGPAAAQDSDGRSVSGTVRAGAEYDDNVFRSDTQKEGGALSRYYAALDVASRAWGPAVVSASLSHGGKFFFSNTHGAADTLLSQGSVAYRHRLLEPLVLFAQADVRDRTERVLKRDYTTGGVGAGLEGSLGPATLRLGGGGRFFAYKPNPEASSANIEGLSTLTLRLPASFSLNLGYNIARRAFDTDRFTRVDEDVVEVEGELRRDVFWVSRAGFGYRGKVVADLSYAYSANSSNSFGQGLRRHSLELTVTAPLPWRLFASVHGELQRTTYDDPVRIDASFLVDEDNRNAAVLSLVRAIGDHWEIETRYSLYLQEFGVGGDYSRQTIFLAGAYVFD